MIKQFFKLNTWPYVMVPLVIIFAVGNTWQQYDWLRGGSTLFFGGMWIGRSHVFLEWARGLHSDNKADPFDGYVLLTVLGVATIVIPWLVGLVT